MGLCTSIVKKVFFLYDWMLCYFFVIPNLLCVNSFKLHKKKLHLFLITWDGSLDHLNCKAWVRALGSGSLELLCPLSVKLYLVIYVWIHRTAFHYYFCRATIIHIRATLQGDSMEHAYLWLGTCLILTKESKKGKSSLTSLHLSRCLCVRDQPGNKQEKLCIQHQYMFVLLFFISETADVRFESPSDQATGWSSISIPMLV